MRFEEGDGMAEMKALIKSFLQYGRLTFSDFKGFWCARGMSLLHLSWDPTVLDPARCTELLFCRALSLLVDPPPLSSPVSPSRPRDGDRGASAPEHDPGGLGFQIGALFLVYCLFKTQRNDPKVPIRLGLSEMASIVTLRERLKRSGAVGKEPLALVQQMVNDVDCLVPSTYSGPGHYQRANERRAALANLLTPPLAASKHATWESEDGSDTQVWQEILKSRTDVGHENDLVVKRVIPKLANMLALRLGEPALSQLSKEAGVGERMSRIRGDFESFSQTFSGGGLLEDPYSLAAYTSRTLQHAIPQVKSFWPRISKDRTRSTVGAAQKISATEEQEQTALTVEKDLTAVEMPPPTRHIKSVAVRHILEERQKMLDEGRSELSSVRRQKHQQQQQVRGNILAKRRQFTAETLVGLSQTSAPPRTTSSSSSTSSQMHINHRALSSNGSQPQSGIGARRGPPSSSSSVRGNILARPRVRRRIETDKT